MGDAGGLIWYAADMDPALGDLAGYFGAAAKVGTYADLLALFRSLGFAQIDFGLLIAISETSPSSPVGIALSAEGSSGARWPGSEIELLAFDDTYIEVTTDREKIVEKLKARFPTGQTVDTRE